MSTQDVHRHDAPEAPLGGTAGPAGTAGNQQVAVEVAWCPACHADRTVEVVMLAGDPGPVSVCVECGLGVETWWTPVLAPHSGPTDAGRFPVARAS